MTRGSKHKITSKFSIAGSPSLQAANWGYTSLTSTSSSGNTIFYKLHLVVRTAGWGSKGDKEMGEHIKMYSASDGKYDMRANTRKG